MNMTKFLEKRSDDITPLLRRLNEIFEEEHGRPCVQIEVKFDDDEDTSGVIWNNPNAERSPV